MKRLAWFTTTLLIVISILLGACTQSSTPTPPPAPTTIVTEAPVAAAPTTAPVAQKEPETCQPKGDLVVGIPSIGFTLDNSQLTWGIEGIVYSLYDTLVNVDFKGNYVPGLAKSWEISSDGLTYTFHLRDDVKFHDGTPFNAEAVKFHIEAYRNGPNAYFYEAVKEVEVKDEHTAIMHLSHPFPNLLFTLSNYYAGMMSPTAYKKEGAEEFATKGVGTGPFILDSFVPGDKAVFHRNPDYNWGPDYLGHKGPACVNTITFQEMPEETTRINALKSGQVQVVEEPGANFVNELKNDPNFKVLDSPQPALVFVALNTKQPPLDDLEVRKAISMLVDRKALLHTLWYDEGTIDYGVLPFLLPEASESEKNAFPYNPDEARKVLEADGWKDTNGDGVLDKDGKPLAFNLSSTNQTIYARTTEAIQGMLIKAGMKVDVRQYNDLTDLQKSGNSQATMNWTKWANADNIDFYFLDTNIPYPNWVGWNDAKSKELLNTCWGAATLDERTAAYRALNNYLTSQVLWVTLFSHNELRLMSKNVAGLQQNPYNSIHYLPIRFVSP